MIYERYQDNYDFMFFWYLTCEESDGCSSGPAKYVSKALFWFGNLLNICKPRNYKCVCLQHDFDYRWGSMFGMVKIVADSAMKLGIHDSTHPGAGTIMYSAVNWFGGNSFIEHGHY